jgi:hypothetical protein
MISWWFKLLTGCGGVVMKSFKLLSVAVLLVLTVACAGIPVSTDYDTSRTFSSLKTYAWMTPKKVLIIDPLVDNDLMNRRVQRAVERRLAALGFSKASEQQGADFFITYHVSAEDRISVSNFHSSFGYYPCWNGCYGPGFGSVGMNDVSVRHYKQGTFMLDVVDPASSELMWRGIAGKRLASGTPQERDAYVDSIVDAILAKFPPSLSNTAP